MTKTFNLLWQCPSQYVDAALNSSYYFVHFIFHFTSPKESLGKEANQTAYPRVQLQHG
jgi:hypothetical protein